MGIERRVGESGNCIVSNQIVDRYPKKLQFEVGVYNEQKKMKKKK